MKHEWAYGCKARSHGSDQVLITHIARAGLFIFNLHRYVVYFQFAGNIFSLHFAQKAKSRGGTLVTRAYIKESTYS